MSLAPERISIKRRRQEEPVETLYLEQATAPDRKRRVTDFYFQRVQNHVIAPLSQQQNIALQAARSTSSAIPSVRWSAPGDDIRDYEKLKVALKAKTRGEDVNKSKQDADPKIKASQSAGDQPPLSSSSVTDKSLQSLRRFHLTRHLASVLSPAASGGIRKQKMSIRPPLATFVERRMPAFNHEQKSAYQSLPLDKVLDTPDQSKLSQGASEEQHATLETLQSSKRTTTKTFVMAGNQSERNGTSIRDHPSTWNHDSDQLADELAALAMEFDPDIKEKEMELDAQSQVEKFHPPATAPGDSERMTLDEDDYVYETYVRVRHAEELAAAAVLDYSTSVGVLVIDEEDEDLWHKYVDSDQEDDWDEEDSNAEDNPSNDYPEDEVSSDDEYSRNAYKYRQYDSDNEYEDDKW